MLRLTYTLAFLLLLALPQEAFAFGRSRTTDAERVYQRAEKSCVEILVNGRLAGSGWFAAEEGLVITAAHVVARPQNKVEVLSPVAGRLTAEVVAVDIGVDAALLLVRRREGGYPTLSMAEKVPPVGTTVYLFGTPLFRHSVMVTGSIARQNTAFEYVGGNYVEIVHVAADTAKGFSGAPWMNSRGEVIGLQSGSMTYKDSQTGIAFMPPVDRLRRLIETRENAHTATLGIACEEIWEQQADLIKRFPDGSEGVVVRIINEKGLAAKAGIKQWDLIIKADGSQIRYRRDLVRAVRKHQPGEKMTLDLVRPDGAGQYSVEITLGWLEAVWAHTKNFQWPSNRI